uniref:LRAT domain-containing protein n=1 Tax=Gouania willdenowi TaxID=441366 RepID=A0A8C5DSL0_GOUWI
MEHSSTESHPGDRIEFLQGIYHHWALYVGDGDVVHLTPYCKVPFLSLTLPLSLVQKDKLSDVVGYDGWRVNNDLDKKHVPRRAEDIVTAARHAVGRELDYSVVTKNCEHFVNKLRYARGESQQVNALFNLNEVLCGTCSYIELVWTRPPLNSLILYFYFVLFS